MSNYSEVMLEIERNELSLRKIAEKYNIGLAKVKTLKHKGRWYVDLLTENPVVSIKEITEEQKWFNVIYDYMLKYEKVCKPVTDEEKIITAKSLIVRIAKFLGVNDRTCYRWSKEEVKLVEQCYLLPESKRYIVNMYKIEESNTMREFYDLETRYPKGFKLYYTYYGMKEGFAYYINICARRYYSWTGTERDFIELLVNKAKEDEELKTNPFVVSLSAKLGIQVTKWIRLMESKGYDYSECISCLRNCEGFIKDEDVYRGDLKPPRILYYETRGFTMLPEEIQYRLITMNESGEIFGSFDYDIMEWEVKKLEYKLKNTS